MRLVIVSDAWQPQTNGVVRTLQAITRELTRRGHQVDMVTPDGFTTVPCPTYGEVRLALTSGWELERRLMRSSPDSIHIATEGPLGIVARRVCRRRGIAFTTSFHTKYPDYIRSRFGIPRGWTWNLLRRFHAPAACTMVATGSIERELESHGFQRLRRWTRGVDLTLFEPSKRVATDWPRPIFLSVGRIAMDKNLEAFLDLDLPGTKLVVGDGPERPALQQRYPNARFLGTREREELASIYATSDVFVFPSLTDTFGLVMLEALASGIPVAAFPVAGPLDVIGDSGAGKLSQDLRQAALDALGTDPALCRSRAAAFTWEASAEQFLANLNPLTA
jgi:glycosyltransferase involved in cell wall biosynthesis